MSKTPKGRRLAAALRNARESRGLTLRELGRLTGRNSGVLSRYETGDRTPKPEDVAQLLTAMQVRGEEYEVLLSLAYDTDAPDWIASTQPHRLQQMAALLDMEHSAVRIDHATHSVFPGLLQSEPYITAIMSSGRLAADDIANRVSFRIRRQTALQNAEFVSYLGEAALYWMVGGTAVMVDQLRHVLRLMELPNVHVPVVPFSSGWQPALDGPFMVLDGSVVHVDTGGSSIFLHTEDDVQAYLDAIDQLGEVAYGEAQSRVLLVNRLRELERVARR
jgi:transcriptional regulator with XRE-family HTH domain